MKIEVAKRSDLSEILRLQYVAYQSEAELFRDKLIPPLTQTLEEVESEYERGTIVKAVNEDGSIIGSVRAYRNGNTVSIGKLFVDPAYQGNGYGTKLLLFIEEEYSSCCYELFTSSKSISNLTLYKRLGYKEFMEKQITDELKFVYLRKGN